MIPSRSCGAVPLYPDTLIETVAKAVAGRRVAGLGRHPVPVHGGGFVFWNTDAEFTATAQIGLGRGIAQPCGGLIPLGGLALVPGHQTACLVKFGHQILGPGHTALGGRLQALQGARLIHWGADAVQQADAQVAQRRMIAKLCRPAVQ